MKQDATDRSIATLYFRNRYLLVLTMVVVVVAGLLGALSLPITEDPIITNRNPLVVTLVPGSSAGRVEALVTEKIEAELKEIAEISDLNSTSRAGISTVSITLADAVRPGENDRLFSEIRDKLADAALQFPPEALAPVLEDQRNPVAYTLILGLTWEGDGEPALGILDRHATALAEELRNVPGTQIVEIFGAPEEELRVTVDADELAVMGLNVADVARATAGSDSKAPAGVFRGDDGSLPVEVTGAFETAERVAEVPLARGPDGSVLRVGDVAEVRK
ncbi:MAG: efflux RND transporter permease subunit, partial [Planctomycetota bacterium]